MTVRYRAKWVVPVAAPPIPDGAVVVDGDRIAWVGPFTRAPAGETRDLGDVALMPGLVNAHCHLELTAMRGFLEGLEFFEWVTRLTMARREVLDDAVMLRSARAGIREGLRAGITTYADTGASGMPMQAMHDMGVRGIAYHEVFGPDPAKSAESLAGLREAVDRLREFASARVRLGVSPHAPYSVSAPLFAAVGEFARDQLLPVAIHCAESAAESAYVLAGAGPFADNQRGRGIDIRARGTTPVAYLETTGILARRPLLIHCVRVDRADIASIAAAGCAVAHCPASNAKLAHGVAPVADMREAGIRVGVGTDSVASNNRMDMLAEARLAALVSRATTQRHDSLPAADVVRMATLDSARALGLDAEIGSLEPGKQADLAAFDLRSPSAHGAADPIAALAFSLTGADAVFTAVAGEPLMSDRRLDARLGPDDDLADLARALAGWRERRSAGRPVR